MLQAIEPDSSSSVVISQKFRLKRFLEDTKNQLHSIKITDYGPYYKTNQLLTFLININKFGKSEVTELFPTILDIFKKFFEKITTQNLQNLSDQDQDNALHYLCNFPFSNKSQASQLLDLFLTKFNIESINIRGETILHQAVKSRNLILIQALSEKGVNFKNVDLCGNTIFHFFNARTKENYLEDFKTLQHLMGFYFSEIVNQEKGQPPISMSTHLETHQALIKDDEDQPSISMSTSMSISMSTHLETYQVNNDQLQNPLEFAISNGEFDNFIFWLTFRQRIIPQLQDEEYLQLALKSLNADISAPQKKESQKEIILSLSHKLSTDQKKQLLFEIAKRCGQICDFELLTAFLSHIAKSNKQFLDNLSTIKDSDGNNVLHIFLQNYHGSGDEQISLPFYFEELMNNKNNNGFTPIMMISLRGLTNIFKKINSSKIEFQKTSKNGFNALHYAIKYNQPKMIQLLYSKHPTLLKLATNNTDSYSIAEFAIFLKKPEAIKTIFSFKELKFDAQKVGKMAVDHNDSEILKILIESEHSEKLKKDFFNDYFFTLITNFPRDIDKLKLLFLSGFDPNTRNHLDQSALELALDSDLDDDNKIKLIKLLAENYADTAILKDKVVKDLRVEKCLSCFCRVESRLHSLKINDFLKKITSKESQDFYQKKHNIKKHSVKLTETYQKLLTLKEYKELANSSQHDDSKRTTLELIKSFKFIQVLQENSKKEKQHDDLSQSKQIKILLRVALNNDQLTPSAFRFLRKYLKDPASIDKFSFLKNLTNQQIICLSKDLSKKLDSFEFDTSIQKKIPKYCDNFQEQFADFKYSDENLEKKFIQLKQSFARYNSKLLDCYELVDSIRLGNKIEDTELEDIFRKIVDQQPKKLPSISGEVGVLSKKNFFDKLQRTFSRA